MQCLVNARPAEAELPRRSQAPSMPIESSPAFAAVPVIASMPASLLIEGPACAFSTCNVVTGVVVPIPTLPPGLSAKESHEVKNRIKTLLEMVDTLGDESQQPITGRNDELQKKLTNEGLQLGLAIKHTSPPKELILLGRKVGGMLSLLKELNAKINLHQVKQDITGINIAS